MLPAAQCWQTTIKVILKFIAFMSSAFITDFCSTTLY